MYGSTLRKGDIMSIISTLAEKMLESQSFEYQSINEAKATIEHAYRNKTLCITYDKLSLFIYSHNLTQRQYWILGQHLNKWFDTHNNEAQKMRIEYGILFQYALLHPEFQQANIIKELRPDFIVKLNGKNIGIEVTRLEKESDNIASKIISEHTKPGMKANEILAIAFRKHGSKVKEYEIIELEKDVFAIHHIESMLISANEFVGKIEKKILKYRGIARNFDEFIVLCNAQKGITITSESDAKNMIDEVLVRQPDVDMNIAVMYIASNGALTSTEYSPD